jgi:hypothetical protein
VKPLDGYRLRVSFNDGVVREVDFARDLEHAEGTLAEPLRDPAYFRRVRVDAESRTIVWPNGLDPDPEVLHRFCAERPAPGRSGGPVERFPASR